jgi:hypothetical protein
MKEAVFWWMRYLRIFVLNPPWGIPGKFTVGVTAHTGEQVSKMLGLTPKEVVDAYGRPCLQVETDDHLIAFEWLKSEKLPGSASPVSWGGKSSTDKDPRDRYHRTANGLELKKPWGPP